MANGYPQFGNGSPVPVLDLGQVGGARAAGGTALGTFALVPGRSDVKIVEHKLAQQSVVFEDNLGFAGQFYTMAATMRASTRSLMNRLLAEIEQRKSGQLRDPTTGLLQLYDPSMVQATVLTDVEGNVLSTQARIRDWRQVGRTQSNTTWAAIVRVAIEFRLLG